MIDLSKAFDTINHNLLIEKLNVYGIHGVKLSWFSDYWRKKTESDTRWWALRLDWIDKGCPLGPILFLLFVNDLPDVVEHCTVNLYADDTTIYSTDEKPCSTWGQNLERCGKLDKNEQPEDECSENSADGTNQEREVSDGRRCWS